MWSYKNSPQEDREVEKGNSEHIGKKRKQWNDRQINSH